MIDILLYKGLGGISKAIRWQTRSEYSHAAVRVNGYTYEAWHVGGVRMLTHPRQGHDPKTRIDVYRVVGCEGELDEAAVEAFLEEQVGKAYDFQAVFRFLTRRPAQADDRWFCSELAEAAMRAGGCPLISPRVPPSYLSPRDIVLSPRLQYNGYIDVDV